MSRPRLQALLPYFGAKRQMANKILEIAGPHKSFWDVMCGSCSVALAHPGCRQIVVNDTYGAVINLARVVASDELAPSLFERLYRTTFCESLYLDSVEWLKATPNPKKDPLGSAYHYFVVCWQGRNGFAGTTAELSSGLAKRYSADGGDPATRFRNVVENIPEFWEKMRHWTILQENSLALVQKIHDKRGAVIYIDPPYLDKSADYVCDFGEADHGILAESLRRFKKARVIVSYYEHELLEPLYLRHGFEKITVKVPKNLSVTKGAVKAPEVLLVRN